MLRNRLILLILGSLLASISFSCSSNKELERSENNEAKNQLDTLSLRTSIEMSRRAIVQQTELTSLYRYGIDSIVTDDDAVDNLMAIARQRYGDALRLQGLGSQDSSAIEFESAIDVRNVTGTRSGCRDWDPRIPRQLNLKVQSMC